VGVQKCPGQDRRYWRPDDIGETTCPVCGCEVELWKDEGVTKCPECGFSIRNPKVELGCARWCAYAVECIGYDPGEEGGGRSIRERLISVMQERLAGDNDSIHHTLRVLGWAEKIVTREAFSPLVVKAAAVLHEVFVRFPGREDEALRDILAGIELERGQAEELALILTNYSRGKEMDSIEFVLFKDAHLLAELQEGLDGNREEGISGRLICALKTENAKVLAAELCGEDH
jgi:hypothetical protein